MNDNKHFDRIVRLAHWEQGAPTDILRHDYLHWMLTSEQRTEYEAYAEAHPEEKDLLMAMLELQPEHEEPPRVDPPDRFKEILEAMKLDAEARRRELASFAAADFQAGAMSLRKSNPGTAAHAHVAAEKFSATLQDSWERLRPHVRGAEFRADMWLEETESLLQQFRVAGGFILEDGAVYPPADSWIQIGEQAIGTARLLLESEDRRLGEAFAASLAREAGAVQQMSSSLFALTSAFDPENVQKHVGDLQTRMVPLRSAFLASAQIIEELVHVRKLSGGQS